MAPVGFEPTISAGELPQTWALDRAATGTGTKVCLHNQKPWLFVLHNTGKFIKYPWRTLFFLHKLIFTTVWPRTHARTHANTHKHNRAISCRLVSSTRNKRTLKANNSSHLYAGLHLYGQQVLWEILFSLGTYLLAFTACDFLYNLANSP